MKRSFSNGSSRARSVPLPNCEGYHFYLVGTCRQPLNVFGYT